MPRVKKPHFADRVLSEGVNNFSKAWARYFQELRLKAGLDKPHSLGGNLGIDYTPVGNVGTGEDNLVTFSLERNIMDEDGDTLEIIAYGSLANNTNAKELALYLGSTEIFNISGSGADVRNQDWCIRATVIRKGVSSQDCISSYTASSLTKSQYTTATEDLSTTLTLKLTGEATSDNDIVQNGLIINYYPRF